jgi:TRAP-type mannitol/chloroaromatic compound transport system permease small subunit
MSGGYTLLRKGHVRMDLFYARWSPRRRAWVDLLTSFLPLVFCGLLLLESYDLARESVALREVAEGLLHAPLYPLRVAIVLGILLLLLQVVRDVLSNLLLITQKD